MADKRALVQVKKISTVWIVEQFDIGQVKNISPIWIVEQFDIGQLRCGTSLVQHFRSSKFSDK